MRLTRPSNRDKAPSLDDNAVHHETPVMEHVAGVVFPYRGQEQHGVEATDPWQLGPDVWDEYTAVEPEPEPRPEPIPVKIVPQDRHELRTITVGQLFCDSTPRILAGRNEARTKLTVANTSTTTVYVNANVGVSPLNGFPITPGDKLELVSEDVLYGISADGSQASVAVLQEKLIEEV